MKRCDAIRNNPSHYLIDMKIDFRMSFGEKNEKTSDFSSEAFLISLGLPLFAAGEFGLLLTL